MRFLALAQTMQECENVTSTIKIRRILADFLKKVPVSQISQVTLILSGTISPESSEIRLSMAQKRTIEAIAKASGKKKQDIALISKRLGDLGLATQKVSSKKRASLTTTDVFSSFEKIAQTSGKGSQQKKVDLLAALLKKATPLESRYITRLVIGRLRLGSAKLLLLDALAIAFTGDVKNKKKIELAYNLDPDIGSLAKDLKRSGLSALKSSIKTARPIKMMLCQRVKDIKDIKKHMDIIVAEEKYDGERIQAHKSGQKIVLYSRRLDDVTHQYPDVVLSIKKNVKEKECILDGEVVPVDKKGNYLPFQILMSRKRKHDIEHYVKNIPVCYIVFDVLKIGKKDLLKMPFPERRKILKKTVRQNNGIRHAVQIQTKDMRQVQKFFNQASKKGTEGIIAKSGDSDSIYRAGSRGWAWIKWKKDYVKGLLDTFDLVVIGAYHGKGRRAGAYGALLCAAYNKNQRCYESFCKVGTGFSDELLKSLPKKFSRVKTRNIPKDVKIKKQMMPDILFRPVIVVELSGAEITRSSTHTCALKDNKGLALRFPRFLRFRSDKRATQSTTSVEIKQMAKKR